MKLYPIEIFSLLLDRRRTSGYGDAAVASSGHVYSIGGLEHLAAKKWITGFNSSAAVLPVLRGDWSFRFATLPRDIILAGSLGLLNLIVFWPEDSRSRLVAALVMTLVAYGALAYRTRIPITAFIITNSASLLTSLLLPAYTLTPAVGIALYTVASCCARRSATSCLAIALTPEALRVVLGVQYAGRSATLDIATVSAVAYGCIAFAAFALGLWSSTNRRLSQEKQHRVQLELNEAVAAERERIAADLHDSLAHAITGIMLQSAGARDVAGHDGQGVQRALDNIEATARQAMRELRPVLDPVEVHKIQGSTAYPGICAIRPLVDSLTDAGHTVHVTSVGHARQLDATTDLVAYRVIQEALANVAKHGCTHTQVDLNLGWDADSLAINITNTSASHRSRREFSECRGLTGMQRRVELVRGDIKFGVTDGGAYEVVVRLPIPRTEASV